MDEKRAGRREGPEYIPPATSDSLESSSASFARHGVKSVEGQAGVNESREENNNIDQSRSRSPVKIPNFTSDGLKAIDHTQNINTVDDCKQRISKKQSYELTSAACKTMDKFIRALHGGEGSWKKVTVNFTSFSAAISVMYDGAAYTLIPPDDMTKGLKLEDCIKMYKETLALIYKFHEVTFDEGYKLHDEITKIDNFITAHETKIGGSAGLDVYNEAAVSLTIEGDFLTCNINSFNSRASQSLALPSNFDQEDEASLLGNHIIANTLQNNYNSQISEKQRNLQLVDLEKKLQASKASKSRFTEDELDVYDSQVLANIINNKLRATQQNKEEFKIAMNVVILNEDITKLGNKVADRGINQDRCVNIRVIANPAHPNLQRGGGACAAIWEAATGTAETKDSKALDKECQRALKNLRKKTLQPGDAVVTDGFNLCSKIIHTIGPCLDEGTEFNSCEKLKTKEGRKEIFNDEAEAYYKILNLSKGIGYNAASTIMGAGIFKVDPYDSLTSAVAAMDLKNTTDKDHEVKLYIAYKKQKQPGALFTDIEIALAKKHLEHLNNLKDPSFYI